MMSQIVRTDRMSTSVTGTFCAVEKDYLFASIASLICFEITAESADETSEGHKTFKTNLFGKITALSGISIKMRKFEEIKQ